MESDRLLLHLIRFCGKYNYSVKLINKRVLPGKCKGYFDPETRCITVAAADPYWLWILAHEAGHLNQEAKRMHLCYQSELTVQHWEEGRRFKPAVLSRAIRNVQRSELDAERFAFSWLKECGADQPYLDECCRRANLYVWEFWFNQQSGRVLDLRINAQIRRFLPTKLMWHHKISNPPAALQQILWPLIDKRMAR